MQSAALSQAMGKEASRLRSASPVNYPCLQHNEWMRASGKDRPCKEQGTIPDHTESESSRTQKRQWGWGSCL